MLLKLLIKMTCVGVIVIGGTAYMMSTQGKDPMQYLRAQSIELPDLSLPDFPDLPKLDFNQPKQAGTTVYQWTDAQGGTQFSTSPPQGDISFKTLHIDPNVNIVPATPSRKNDSEEKSKRTTVSSRDAAPTYKDVGKIREQIDQIKSINAGRVDNLNALIKQQEK